MSNTPIAPEQPKHPDGATCGTCKWWVPEKEQKGVGACRGAPPMAFPFQQQHKITGQIVEGQRIVFPMMPQGQWCGLHTPKAGMKNGVRLIPCSDAVE